MDKRHLLSLKSRMAGVMVKPAAKKGWHQDLYIDIQ
jgi:hypothetical protein